MKRTGFLFLLSFIFLASYASINGSSERGNELESIKEDGKDHPIVGRWEYVKTIRPDGSEVIELIATEHYYADGTFLYVNVYLTPHLLNEFSNSPEEIKRNYKSGYGGIGNYKIEKRKEKDILTYTRVASTQMEKIGNSVSIEIKVDKDTLIFYTGDGAQVICKRVSD